MVITLATDGSAKGAERGKGNSQRTPKEERGRPRGNLVLSRLVQAKENGLWLPVDLTLEAWCQIGLQITAINNSSSWWIGDWLVYGRKRFPDRYKQAITETSLDYQTLRNYAWVSRQFPTSRRRGRMSFQHHAEVAALAVDEQEAWLNKAEENGWSTHKLRRQLKAACAGLPTSDTAAATVRLSITPGQRNYWQAAAAARGIDLEHWIILQLDTAASRSLGDAT